MLITLPPGMYLFLFLICCCACSFSVKALLNTLYTGLLFLLRPEHPPHMTGPSDLAHAPEIHIKLKIVGCSQRGLNSRPLDYETNALPTAPWKPAKF